MIRVSNNFAKAMEFTSFRKKETATDDELINAVLKFETVLAKQNGVIFHCLVRNFNNEYANVLFAGNIEHLHALSKDIFSFREALDFFALIENDSAKMQFHEILKTDFSVPEGFAGMECGTFSLKDSSGMDMFIKASEEMEKYYLEALDNNLGHFIGRMEDKISEISIGKTYAKTKQECYGYYENQYGQSFLDLADLSAAELDFWYLIA
ncbi:MAG: hypothetical protein LBE91_20875 [Tannerella sp.]|nr:hypothetical protein [Tannerella sp.]